MTLSLYDAFIPTSIQMLEATLGFIAKAEAYCADMGVQQTDLLEERLASDMLPLNYQFKSVAVHSSGAIQALRDGTFTPDVSTPPQSFDGLRSRLADATDHLKSVQASEIEELRGKQVFLVYGEHRLPFTVDNFILSFSQPNLFFHVATAYDILRARGLAIGKGDYLGKLRIG